MTDHDETEGPDGTTDNESRRAREDAEWRAIVENYGEHPEFTSPPESPRPEHRAHREHRDPRLQLPAELGPSWSEDDDRYVPPPPPPVPRPHGLRLVAWFGLFGVPTLVLVCIVLGFSLPSPLGLLALVWFLGGFGYLVATMSGPDDSGGGWDDGAVV
ncbi:MAG TPA: hypothetical protein VGE14_01385 [Marmoricola sp.]